MTQQCANGHDNPDRARFCRECGIGIDPAARPTGPPSPEPPAAPPGPAAPTEPPAPTGDDRAAARKRRLLAAVIVGGILVAVVVGIVVASSGSDDEPSRARARTPEALATVVPAAPPATGTTPDDDTATTNLPARAVGDTVTFPNGATIQVFSYEQPVPADRFFEPDPGNEFAVIDVEFCASPTTETPYNALGFATRMADDRRFEALSGGVRTPRLNSGDLPAGGGCTRGWVLLQVPVGERPALVVWDYPRYVEASWVVPTG